VSRSVLDALGENRAETANDGEERPAARGRWSLRAGEIHVWRADFEESRDGGLPQPRTPRERVRARKRRSWAAVRIVLAGYLSCRPSDLRFERGRFGKPSLVLPHSDLEFNLSRCDDRCLIAVSRSAPVGVDLERVRPIGDVARMADRVFSPAEACAIRSEHGDARLRAFLNCWTRKEACAKAIGLGLMLPFDQFGVSTGEHPEPAVVTLADHDPGAWTLRALDPWRGYVGAVVTRQGLSEAATSMRTFSGWG
jgi:4'-phosphopantetheinyl transferase